MNARSALFDLYGDHLRPRGGQAPVACLVRLLAPLGVAAPAVRTAVSRMVRQDWLDPVRLDEGPGYRLTPRAVRRLDDSAARIYRTRDYAWDGTWHLLVTSPPADRARRDRLRTGLVFLGYAPLADTTWVGPRASGEVDALLAAEGVRADRFTARHDGDSAGLVRRAWDLDGLSRSYARWHEQAMDLLGHPARPGDDASGDDASGDSASGQDERDYAARSRLVHEWRKFLFLDPGLPRELLPGDWAGEKAADFFDVENERLMPGATRFVERCLLFPGGAS